MPTTLLFHLVVNHYEMSLVYWAILIQPVATLDPCFWQQG